MPEMRLLLLFKTSCRRGKEVEIRVASFAKWLAPRKGMGREIVRAGVGWVGRFGIGSKSNVYFSFCSNRKRLLGLMVLSKAVIDCRPY